MEQDVDGTEHNQSNLVYEQALRSWCGGGRASGGTEGVVACRVVTTYGRDLREVFQSGGLERRRCCCRRRRRGGGWGCGRTLGKTGKDDGTDDCMPHADADEYDH